MVNRAHARGHHRLSELLDNWTGVCIICMQRAVLRLVRLKKGEGKEKVEDVHPAQICFNGGTCGQWTRTSALETQSILYYVTKSWKHKIINTGWVLLLLRRFGDNGDDRQTIKAESSFFQPLRSVRKSYNPPIKLLLPLRCQFRSDPQKCFQPHLVEHWIGATWRWRC